MNSVVDVSTQNRRQFTRVTPAPNAPIRVDINGDGFIEVIQAVDISEGGIHISVTHRFAGCHVDQPATFIIYLPQPINKSFSVEGRIMHVRDDSFGVLFTNLNDRSRALIRSYIGLWLRKRTAWDYVRYVFGR